jgi:dTDP-glucose 4,6-dehydratase/UDP-glucuronate decarboxylase
MHNLHQRLLEEALDQCAHLAPSYGGRAVYLCGASGFLAANLLVFLDTFSRRHNLNLTLYASARRPRAEVRLFNYLDNVHVSWSIAAVETAILPLVDNLTIIHAASFGSPRDYLKCPFETYEANATGLLHLIRQGRSLSGARLVYLSSAEVYGQPPDTMIPTPETYVGGMDTTKVRSIYGESKRIAEVLASCVAAQDLIPVTILRPWNVYGPGQRVNDGRVPIEFIRQALVDRSIRLSSNGSPRRSFCYAWDAICQIVAAMSSAESPGAFNIGNGDAEVSILDLAMICASRCNLGRDAVTYDTSAGNEGMQRCAPDVHKVTALFPTPFRFTPLETGIDATLEWMQAAIR